MRLAFTLDDYQRAVESFARRLPDLLARTSETADLAVDVERLAIAETLRARFTVAVVGQMRAGKSTLLNALIGRDLAPTGITETTATVNWFRWDPGERTQAFRVHWADGSEADFPLAAIADWLHAGAHTATTRWLDFFSSSAFLQTAFLVDTPGTRSTLDRHEQAAHSFVEGEAASGRADAILYVVNPVARESDRDLLAQFGDLTRMAGASVHNSIAVVQKWEHLDQGPWQSADPEAEIARKCAHMFEQLRTQVAAVVPASGMLARCAADPANGPAWEVLARMAAQCDDDDFEVLTDSEDLFCEADEVFAGGVPSQLERQAVVRQIPWPAVRLSLREARRRRLGDAAALLGRVRALSGIDALAQLLGERFLKQAALIKANTVLRRAWLPCQVALARLGATDQHLRDELGHCQALRQRLAAVADAPLRGELDVFVSARELELRAAVQRVRELRADLDQVREEALRNHEALDGDLRTIGLLLETPGLSPAERGMALQVCGRQGHAIASRLGLPADAPMAVLVETAEERLAWAQARSGRGARHGPIFAHIAERLGQMLEALEA